MSMGLGGLALGYRERRKGVCGVCQAGMVPMVQQLTSSHPPEPAALLPRREGFGSTYDRLV